MVREVYSQRFIFVSLVYVSQMLAYSGCDSSESLANILLFTGFTSNVVNDIVTSEADLLHRIVSGSCGVAKDYDCVY